MLLPTVSRALSQSTAESVEISSGLLPHVMSIRFSVAADALLTRGSI
jgi:hypothetical protein